MSCYRDQDVTTVNFWFTFIIIENWLSISIWFNSFW